MLRDSSQSPAQVRGLRNRLTRAHLMKFSDGRLIVRPELQIPQWFHLPMDKGGHLQVLATWEFLGLKCRKLLPLLDPPEECKTVDINI